MFDFKNPLNNIRKYFDQLNLIFYFLVSVPLIFFIYAYLQYEEAGGLLNTTSESFQVTTHIIIPLISLVALLLSWLYYKRKIKEAAGQKGLSEKLQVFYRVILARYGIITIGSLAACVGLYLKGEQLFAILYTVLLVATSLIRPTPKRVFEDLKLTEEDEKAMSNQEGT